MKTHELARALTALGKMLRNLPNEEMGSFEERVGRTDRQKAAEIAVSLSTLASLSTYGKQEWTDFISDFDLPIEVRNRDASRDILGKILKYLEENKDVRERIVIGAQGKRGSSSNELNRALRILLSDG